MPIEFRCSQCAKLLRTPDETGGQQAKCPMCGAVMKVPGAAEATRFEPADVSPFLPTSTPSSDAANPYQAPAELGSYDAAYDPATAAAMPIRPSTIEFSDPIGRTWNVFTEQWGMCLVMFVLSGLVIGGFAALVLGGALVVTLAAGMDEVVVIAVAVLAGTVVWLFAAWIGTGVTLFFIKTARGLPAEIGDLFAGGPYVLRVIGASVLFSLGLTAILAAFALPCGLVGLAFDPVVALVGVCIGAALGIVPATVFFVTFFPFKYLIIDRNLGIMESFAVSCQIMRGNRVTVFLIVTVIALVGTAINQVTCNLGVFVVTPFQMLLFPIIYLLLIGHPTADRRAPNPNQP